MDYISVKYNRNIWCYDQSPKLSIVEKISNIDYMLTTGLSSCFAFYGVCPQHSISILAHISYPDEDLLCVMQSLLSFHTKVDMDKLNTDYYIFGGLNETLEDTLSFIKPSGIRHSDTASRLINLSEQDETHGYPCINLYMNDERILISQYQDDYSATRFEQSFNFLEPIKHIDSIKISNESNFSHFSLLPDDFFYKTR